MAHPDLQNVVDGLVDSGEIALPEFSKYRVVAHAGERSFAGAANERTRDTSAASSGRAEAHA